MFSAAASRPLRGQHDCSSTTKRRPRLAALCGERAAPRTQRRPAPQRSGASEAVLAGLVPCSWARGERASARHPRYRARSDVQDQTAPERIYIATSKTTPPPSARDVQAHTAPERVSWTSPSPSTPAARPQCSCRGFGGGWVLITATQAERSEVFSCTRVP